MTDTPNTIQAGNDRAELVSEDPAAQENSSRSRWNRRIILVTGLIALIAAAVVVPPLINIGSYKHQITALMTRSLGRPVHMSSVELRLLPRPGFVLHDLSVGEDPGFGVEPILSARTVVASIRILSLWQGKLEIDRVSVDEASLNLVRSAQGRWNLESLMMGAQPELTGRPRNPGEPVSRTSPHFPYLEATDSRVNLKNGPEKSPFSIVSTDLSLWQDQPGEWRVRLRGQPVRTDMEMSSADTGEVRMEASLRNAAQLREMPLKLEMEWRDAQLGQLSRLLFGSDAGWRGDVTADINVQGTLDAAQTKTRLRATGVRRAEFAPETPLDFDANCGFLYQHSQNAMRDVDCDTAIGDGRLHLKAELPGNTGAPEAMLEVKQIPLQAGLDLLRTVRSGFAPGISVKGSANGSLTYKEVSEAEKGKDAKKPQPRSAVQKSSVRAGSTAANLAINSPANLHGSLILEGAQLKGGELKEPLVLPRITLAPALVSNATHDAGKNAASTSLNAGLNPGLNAGLSTALGTRFTIALAPTPPAQSTQSTPPTTSQPGAHQPAAPAQAITVRLSLGARGYDVAVNGSAGTTRLRDLAYGFGLPHLDAADSFTGGTADFDFTAAGPWIPSSDAVLLPQPALNPAPTRAAVESSLKTARSDSTTVATSSASQGLESFSGSLQLHHTQWKPSYLASPVDLQQATVTLSTANISLASDFSYGSLKDAGKDSNTNPEKTVPEKPAIKDLIRGSVVVNASTSCKTTDCEPQVQLHFGALDAGELQAVLLGAPTQKTLLSPLIDRMQSSEKPKWPEVAVNVQADSLLLGPVTLQKPIVRLRLKESEITFEDWEADLLGGSAKGKGRFTWAADKPGYAFDGIFSRLNAAPVGALLGSSWTGGPVSGSGSVQLSGLTAKDLAASASGDLRFDWAHGSIPTATTSTAATTSQETHFDDWSGAVAIRGGKAQVGENALRAGKRSTSVAGVIPFGGPAKLTIESPAGKLAANAAHLEAVPAVK